MKRYVEPVASRDRAADADSSVNPSFFRATPAKKPRTECCCQPVAFMIAAMVAPWGRLGLLDCPVEPGNDSP
jgi:hypothetical protein